MSSQHTVNDSDNAFELISATSSWVLARHQWLINTMRCVLTGEQLPTTNSLIQFDQVVPNPLKVSKHTAAIFGEIKTGLEAKWLQTTKTIHPLSGLTVFEQLNAFQYCAHDFIQSSNDANKKLLSELTMHDALTGALTRLALNHYLKEALNHAKQKGKPACIAFLDQHQFKQINDQWGHSVGDAVLAETAELIRLHLRQSDKIFRYGGDEWLILLPETDKAAAETAIARMQSIYEAYAFKTNTEQDIYTRFHVGIAESHPDYTPKSWVDEADKAYYLAKKQTMRSQGH